MLATNDILVRKQRENFPLYVWCSFKDILCSLSRYLNRVNLLKVLIKTLIIQK